MRRLFLLISCSTLLLAAGIPLSSCNESGGSGGITPEAPAHGAWTFMVYMAADNDISNAAVKDINEMEKVGSTDKVTIVVQAEFDSEITPGMPESTVRGRVMKDEDNEELGPWHSSIGNRDMTEPGTLTEFIRWAAETYPADRFALTLWSHGSGWKAGEPSPVTAKGMFIDSGSAGSGSVMSVQDIARAIAESGVPLDVMSFDTCLMGMYEVAYELKYAADYLVFSEDLYPIYGDPYDLILGHLTADPAMDGLELAQTIATDCRDYYLAKDMSMTKSVVAASKMDSLHAGLSTLSEALYDRFDLERANIDEARQASLTTGRDEHHDLGSFLKELDSRTTDEDISLLIGQTMEALSDAVVCNEISGSSSDDPVYGAQGLALYLPGAGQATSSELERYSLLSCSRSPETTWSDLLGLIVTGPGETGNTGEEAAVLP